MSALPLLLIALTLYSICEALSERYYQNDCFRGYQPALEDVINTFNNLTLVHCSAFCVGKETACKSFFHNPGDQTCSLLVRIPMCPSGIRQLTSKNVLYSPIQAKQLYPKTAFCTPENPTSEQRTTVFITPENPTSEQPTTTTVTLQGCLKNTKGCLAALDHDVLTWDSNTCLAFIGPTTTSIDAASSTCHCLGGNLISLDTDDKFDQFHQYLDTHMSGHKRLAIGLRAASIVEPWAWPDGTPLENIPRFCLNEPNGDQSNNLRRRCAVLEYPLMCMDDRNCPDSINHIYFACEYF